MAKKINNKINSSILFLFLISLILFSCGKKDDRNEIKTVYLKQFDSGGIIYEMKIPNAFIRSITGPDVFLNAVYPGMKDPAYRYVYRPNDKREDRVKLTLSIPNKSAKRLYGELGREEMKGEIIIRSSGYVQAPIQENIEENEKVDKYIGIRDRVIYVISQNKHRVSRVTCPFETICTGRTMWNDEIFIRYDFKILNFNKMVDLDRSVVSLIDSFRPKLIKTKEKKL